MRKRITAWVHRITDWLSTVDGLLGVLAVLVIGLGAGRLVWWDIRWQSPYNLFISVLTAVIGMLVLVATAKGAAANAIKIDEVLVLLKPDDRYVGLEDATEEEIAAIKSEVQRRRAQLSSSDAQSLPVEPH